MNKIENKNKEISEGIVEFMTIGRGAKRFGEKISLEDIYCFYGNKFYKGLSKVVDIGNYVLGLFCNIKNNKEYYREYGYGDEHRYIPRIIADIESIDAILTTNILNIRCGYDTLDDPLHIMYNQAKEILKRVYYLDLMKDENYDAKKAEKMAENKVNSQLNDYEYKK